MKRIKPSDILKFLDGVALGIILMIPVFYFLGCSHKEKKPEKDLNGWEHHDPEVDPVKILKQAQDAASCNAMIQLLLLKFDKTRKGEDVPLDKIGKYLTEQMKILEEIESDVGEYEFLDLNKGEGD